jgi:uncharacterized membrane protein YdjX (TVP38/TMEM64 family)
VTRKQILGVISTLVIIAVIILISIIFVSNFKSIINDPVVVRETIQRYGIMAYLVYFLLYIFQIFFAPIPGQILNIVSGMLFGAFKGFLISWLAVIIGGSLAMLVSRFFGKRIINLFLEENAINFEREITRRGLPLILFLALFPNPVGDGLFYLAGLTTLPLKILIFVIALCRIPGILIYVIAGDKTLSLGLKGWLIGGLGSLLAIIFYLIFNRKIERLFECYIKENF